MIHLFDQLKRKRSLFSGEKYRTIFDLDGETNPLDHPLTLLKFDDGDIQGLKSRPHHSQNRVDIIDGQKTWLLARSSWRKKVRALFDQLNIDFPDPFSSDVEE